MVTVTHAEMGERAFGVAPGRAEVWRLLRTLTDDRMEGLRSEAERLAEDVAREGGLGVRCRIRMSSPTAKTPPRRSPFFLGRSTPKACGMTATICPSAPGGFRPLRQSGPGGDVFPRRRENHPSVHTPDYDFPDELISLAARVLMRTLRDLLG